MAHPGHRDPLRTLIRLTRICSYHTGRLRFVSSGRRLAKCIELYLATSFLNLFFFVAFFSLLSFILFFKATLCYTIQYYHYFEPKNNRLKNHSDGTVIGQCQMLCH